MERAEQSVACRIFIQENDVPGLFASKVRANLKHSLQNIPVANLGLLDIDSLFLAHKEETKVAHHCRDNRIVLQRALRLHMVSNNCHNLIAVHLFSVFIHGKHPVGVTVKGNPYICLLIYHPCLKLAHVRRPTVCINVRSIRIIVYCHNFSAKLLERLDRCIVGSALRTVHHNLHSLQINRDGMYCMIDILLPCIRPVLNFSHARSCRKLDILHALANQFLYLILK